jgi:hypothetical protein
MSGNKKTQVYPFQATNVGLTVYPVQEDPKPEFFVGGVNVKIGRSVDDRDVFAVRFLKVEQGDPILDEKVRAFIINNFDFIKNKHHQDVKNYFVVMTHDIGPKILCNGNKFPIFVQCGETCGLKEVEQKFKGWISTFYKNSFLIVSGTIFGQVTHTNFGSGEEITIKIVYADNDKIDELRSLNSDVEFKFEPKGENKQKNSFCEPLGFGLQQKLKEEFMAGFDARQKKRKTAGIRGIAGTGLGLGILAILGLSLKDFATLDADTKASLLNVVADITGGETRSKHTTKKMTRDGSKLRILSPDLTTKYKPQATNTIKPTNTFGTGKQDWFRDNDDKGPNFGFGS